MFQKAVKREAKGRVALLGPAGSGKSYTMLTLARKLAGPQGKIAAIDTEHGSLSKYADLFDFDVIELDSYSPDNFLKCLAAAEQAGYSVFCCDSLSHFWVGKDGALEFVDERNKRQKDQMGGWKDWRPHERAMVDAMIASPLHVIVTMRTKTAYEETVDNQGRKKRVKIGLAPVQRDGMEYEFDLVGYMDEDNTMVIDKTRCPAYTGRAIAKPGEKEFTPFAEWLKGAPAQPRPSAPPQATAPPAPQPPPATGPADPPELAQFLDSMTDFAKTVEALQALKGCIVELTGNEQPYRTILEKHGMKASNDLKGRTRAQIKAVARELFWHLKDLQKAMEPPPDEQPLPPAAGPTIDDSDIPEIMGGTHKTDGPSVSEERRAQTRERVSQ